MSLQDQVDRRIAFSSVHEEAYLNLVRTSCALYDRVSEFFKKHGLTDSQYNVLRILRSAHPEGMSCSDIATRMVHRDPDVTRLCDRMVRRELVARARSTQDRRVVSVRITEAGLALLGKMQHDVDRITVSMLEHLGQDEIRELIRLLQKARNLTAR